MGGQTILLYIYYEIVHKVHKKSEKVMKKAVARVKSA